MPGMGPAPKHPSQRRRTNPTVAQTQLPAEGRAGATPDWPLGSASADEDAIWAEMWRSPQSVAWERLGWTRSVARYCRALATAEQKDATAALLAEVRQMEDRLGLTPMSMLRLRWEIAPDELAEARHVPAATKERPRLRAVE
jgi:hypothetical protein